MYEDKKFYVSKCCGAKAYLDEYGYSHCKVCKGLFTGADSRTREMQKQKEGKSKCCEAEAVYYSYLPDFPKCSLCGNPFLPQDPKAKECECNICKIGGICAEECSRITPPVKEEKKCQIENQTGGHYYTASGGKMCCEEEKTTASLGNLGIGVINPSYIVHIKCPCGKEYGKEVEDFMKSLLQATREEGYREIIKKLQSWLKEADNKTWQENKAEIQAIITANENKE